MYILTACSPAAQPVLGRSWAPDQRGYGSAKPSVIDNGGNPTGLVTAIQWQSWGGARAVARGVSEYLAPGEITAAGREEPTTLVAFDLGSCHGRLMYRAAEWFFPQHGESFDLRTYIDVCNGTYVGNGPY
ncbi:MAG: hypothetical protein ACYDAQ_16565 [Mycobacteriales bacterium]